MPKLGVDCETCDIETWGFTGSKDPRYPRQTAHNNDCSVSYAHLTYPPSETPLACARKTPGFVPVRRNPQRAAQSRRIRRHRAAAAATVGVVDARENLKEDVRAATESYKKSVTSPAGLMMAAGVLALISGVVLTVGAIVGLNLLLGTPAGYFIVVGLFAVAAVILLAKASMQREKHKLDAREHVQDARRDLREVLLPLKTAFGKNGR